MNRMNDIYTFAYEKRFCLVIHCLCTNCTTLHFLRGKRKPHPLWKYDLLSNFARYAQYNGITVAKRISACLSAPNSFTSANVSKITRPLEARNVRPRTTAFSLFRIRTLFKNYFVACWKYIYTCNMHRGFACLCVVMSSTPSETVRCIYP